MKEIYRLTVQEEALAARVGWERQLPMLGQPERNRNYSEGDIWEAWQHMLCAASEIAAARMLGIEDFEPHANTFKSKLDIPGYEVRYSFTKNGRSEGEKWALRFNPKADDPNQVYILIAGGPERKTRRDQSTKYEGPAFFSLGWMWGHECMSDEFIAPYGTGNYSVPSDKLHPMSSLPVVEPAGK